MYETVALHSGILERLSRERALYLEVVEEDCGRVGVDNRTLVPENPPS